jgi:hypothetical protein
MSASIFLAKPIARVLGLGQARTPSQSQIPAPALEPLPAGAAGGS